MPRIKPLSNERGEATLIATLLVSTVMTVFAFMSVPFFVFVMQRDHVQMIAAHALKEAEVAGFVTPAIMAETVDKLAAVGMGAITKNGVVYPSFAGSTSAKVLRDDADPSVKLVIQYPAANLSRLMTAIGGGPDVSDGLYKVGVYGRSEAYE